MDRFGVVGALDRRLRRSRQQNEGCHVDLALYARMRGRRLSERRSHSDGARRAAPAPVAKSNLAGPERRGGPGTPPLFFMTTRIYYPLILHFSQSPRRGQFLMVPLQSFLHV